MNTDQQQTDRAMKFAMDALKNMPQGSPQEIEHHLTAVLIVFWGALWGTCGTKFARGFIEAQLSGMEPDREHEVFTQTRVQ